MIALQKKVLLQKQLTLLHKYRKGVISTEVRNERSGEILLFTLLQNGKISPLQNLLSQIFPVEMTQNYIYATTPKQFAK